MGKEEMEVLTVKRIVEGARILNSDESIPPKAAGSGVHETFLQHSALPTK